MELYELCYYEPHPEHDRRVSVLGSDNLPEIIVLGDLKKVEEVQLAMANHQPLIDALEWALEQVSRYGPGVRNTAFDDELRKQFAVLDRAKESKTCP